MAVDEGERLQFDDASDVELRRLVDELTAIYRLADAVTRAESLDEVFAAALDALEDAVGVPRAAVVLFGEDEAIHFRAWRGLSDEYRKFVEGRSPWKGVVGRTGALVIPDVLQDDAVAELHEAFRRERIRSMALIPLTHAGVVLGRFVLYREEPGGVAPEEVKLAEAMASHVAAATLRRRTEDELRQSRNQLEAIFGSVADGITVQSDDGRIVFANDAAARLSGFASVDDLLASPVEEIRRLFEILDEDGEPLPVEELPGRIALARGEATERLVCYRVLATGEERWSVLSATPIRDADGKVLQAINVFRDVTDSRRAQERVHFLGEASRLLASSLDVEETLSRIGRLAVPDLADYCLVDLIEPDGSLNQVLRIHHDPARDHALGEIRRLYPPLDNPAHPVSRVLATAAPVVVTVDPDAELDTISLDDAHRELYRQIGITSFLAAPLLARGEVLGAISFGTSSPRTGLHAQTVELALGLADRAAIAVSNARLYREAEEEVLERQRSEERLRFLAEASRVLSSSLDYETTLQAVARLVVPRFADWCTVYMRDDDGSIRRLAVEHAGGDAELVRAVLDRHPLDPNADYGASLVLRTGRPELTIDETYEHLTGDVVDPDNLVEELPPIEPCSSMSVPLIARGRTLGAISLLTTAESGRRYTEDEVVFATELAGRAAIAVDNALLYGRATETIAQLDAFFGVAPVGLAFFDAEGRFVQINDWLATANGLSVEEHIGRRPVALQAYLGPAQELIDHVLETGEGLFGFEIGVDKPEFGSRRFVASYYPVRDEDGTVLGAGCVIADVTEQHRTESTLRFLSEASETLAGSVDHQETLRGVAALAVPRFADSCVIYLREGEHLNRIAAVDAGTGSGSLVESVEESLDLARDADQPIVRWFTEATPSLLRDLEPVLLEEWQLGSAMVVPLASRGERRGLAVFGSVTRRLGDADLALALEVARRMAVALDRAALYRATRESAALLELQSEASIDGLLVVSPEGRMISFNRRFVEIWGIPDEVLAEGADERALEVAMDKVADPDAFLERVQYLYSHPDETSREELVLKDGRVLDRYGSAVRSDDGTYYGFLWSFRDITERKRSEETVAFLGEASALLASSLDVEETLDSIARLSVPIMADWCSISLRDEDGTIQNVAVAHRDPKKANWAKELQTRYPRSPEARFGVAKVIATGRPELVAELTDEMVAAALHDTPELIDVVRALGLRSLLTVPLVARGSVIGALALATAGESARTLGDADLVLAQEVGRRAAIAVENARLFHALEDQSRLTATVTDNASSALFLIDEHGYPTYMNPAAEEITGWRLEEMADRPLHETIHHTRPDGSPYPREECPIDRAFATGEAVRDQEEMFLRRDGSFFPGIASASPLLRAGSAGTVVELRDITEEKRARAEADALAKAAQALEFVGDGVFLVEATGVVRLWNPAAERITGLAEADVVGREAREALPGWPLAELEARPQTRPVDVGERELWLSLSAESFPEGTVYAFRDLTEEHAIERLKSDFVSTISHELRTPLAAIYGAAMTLQRTDVSLAEDQRQGLLSVVAGESERLARIVNDVLWASRLDSGVLDVSIESCDADLLAQGVVAAARTHLPHGIELDYEVQTDLPKVAADPDKVRQVLVNLLDNAVKYSPDGGQVAVRLTSEERIVRFAISDEGLGIPPSEHERIFEKFYRLDPNLTRGVGGTGLGLYICRELVRRMEGRVKVESEEGSGSTFTIELPTA